MLSRKQQWRMACGHHHRRHSRDCGRPSSTALPETTTSATGPYDQGRSKSCDAHQRAILQRRRASMGAIKSNAAVGGLRGSDCCAVDGDDESVDEDRKRSVSFDQKIQVILVPNRHDLKRENVGGGKNCNTGSARCSGGGEDRGRQQQRLRGKGSVNGRAEDRESNDEGIWWTMRECSEFRLAYRRQILALGLSCTTLLCPATSVFQAGAKEEQEEEEECAAAAAAASAAAGAAAVVAVADT